MLLRTKHIFVRCQPVVRLCLATFSKFPCDWHSTATLAASTLGRQQIMVAPGTLLVLLPRLVALPSNMLTQRGLADRVRDAFHHPRRLSLIKIPGARHLHMPPCQHGLHGLSWTASKCPSACAHVCTGMASAVSSLSLVIPLGFQAVAATFWTCEVSSMLAEDVLQGYLAHACHGTAPVACITELRHRNTVPTSSIAESASTPAAWRSSMSLATCRALSKSGLLHSLQSPPSSCDAEPEMCRGACDGLAHNLEPSWHQATSEQLLPPDTGLYD